MLEDAEYAIINFFEYQLSTNRGKLNTGEKYLRLYGVLNAVYLQSQAILEIAEIVKYPQKRGIYQKFSSLNIYETRNIAGSHTVNFIPHKSIKFPTPNNEKNHFKVIFSELREDGRKMSVVDGFGKVEEFNLYEDIKEYCGLSELFLIEIVEKYITSLLRNDVGLRTEIKATINKIRNNKTDYRKIDKYKNYDRKIMRRAKKLIEKLKKSTSK